MPMPMFPRTQQTTPAIPRSASPPACLVAAVTVSSVSYLWLAVCCMGGLLVINSKGIAKHTRLTTPSRQQAAINDHIILMRRHTVAHEPPDHTCLHSTFSLYAPFPFRHWQPSRSHKRASNENHIHHFCRGLLPPPPLSNLHP